MFTTFFSDWTWQNVLFRIVAALALGMAIGIDRGVKRRGTDARTSVTICVGAAMIMLLEQYLEILYPKQVDVSRMAAQVISGVGFVGAGSILVASHRIRGLASAAGIWTCACIGLAVGIGFVDGAVILTALWLTGVHLAPRIEEKVYRHSRYIALVVEVENGKAITVVSRLLKEKGYTVDTFTVDKPKAKGQNLQIVTTLKLPKGVHKEECLRTIRELQEVQDVSEI